MSQKMTIRYKFEKIWIMLGWENAFIIDIFMIIMASNNNLDDISKSYEETMRKVNDMGSSEFKQNMDKMKE